MVVYQTSQTSHWKAVDHPLALVSKSQYLGFGEQAHKRDHKIDLIFHYSFSPTLVIHNISQVFQIYLTYLTSFRLCVH